MSSVIRLAVLFFSVALIVSACHVQIEEDGTFQVFGTEPTPSPESLDSCTAMGGTATSEGAGCTVPADAQTPTPGFVTPTPIYYGKLADWSINGTEHIEPTATPRPTPTTAYLRGELTFSGVGNLSVERLSMPAGRYNVFYTITGNDEHTYCIEYAGHFSIGCTSGAIGDLAGERRMNTTGVSGSLTVEIAPEARYRLVFERAD